MGKSTNDLEFVIDEKWKLGFIDGSTSKSNEFTLKVLDLFSNKAKEAQ